MGGTEIGLKAIRRNNGPQVIGKYLGFGTQRTAKALKGTLGYVKTLGKHVGTAGMVLSAYSYGSQLLDKNTTISAATHANFWIGAGLYGAATILGGPIVGGQLLSMELFN